MDEYHQSHVDYIVISTAKIGKDGREIQTFETITVAKINCNKSVGMQLCSWKVLPPWVPSVEWTSHARYLPAGDELVRSSGEGFSHGYIFP